MARSRKEISDALGEMRRAAEGLSENPESRREAESHIQLLERLLVHGETPGHPN
jgi:hypothetical protein